MASNSTSDDFNVVRSKNYSDRLGNIAKGPRFFKKQYRRELKKAEAYQADIDRFQEDYQRRLLAVEQNIRLNSLRIFGVQEKIDEDICVTVLQIFNNVMQLSISVKDIESCYRVTVTNTVHPRPIVIRFVTKEARNKVLALRKFLKGTGIGISEELCTDIALLYNQAGNYFGRNNVRLKAGHVHVILPNKNQLRFRSSSEFDDFISDS